MCGRSCCSLTVEELKCACGYQLEGTDKRRNIEYLPQNNLGLEYGKFNGTTRQHLTTVFDMSLLAPSFNIPPGTICQIIVSKKHFNDKADANLRTLIPALWGIIPRSYKGDYRKHGLTTHNARLEGLSESKLFGPPLEKGQRCVLVAEGYYEWATAGNPADKPVFYIYQSQDQLTRYSTLGKATWKNENCVMTYIAGLFDVWHDDKVGSIFSFATITTESNETMGKIHHRAPAVLETEEQVKNWLNYERYPGAFALKFIKCPSKLGWHRVTNHVNSTKNHSEKCIEPNYECYKSDEKNKNSVTNWLKRKKENESESDDGSSEECGIGVGISFRLSQ